jgi:hypothetical protein
MSSKGKKYHIMTPQPKLREIWGCSNPAVMDGSMCCDGDCWHCHYHYLVETIKEFK